MQDIPSTIPPDDGSLGTTQPIKCRGCGLEATTQVKTYAAVDGLVLATCPECGGPMVWNFGGATFAFTSSKARDFSSTKQGMRRAHSLEKKSERLAKTQWDQHPSSLPEGQHAVNPTPGGTLDPNGPFSKRETHKTIILPSTSSAS